MKKPTLRDLMSPYTTSKPRDASSPVATLEEVLAQIRARLGVPNLTAAEEAEHYRVQQAIELMFRYREAHDNRDPETMEEFYEWVEKNVPPGPIEPRPRFT